MFADLKEPLASLRNEPMTGRALLDKSLDLFEEAQRRLALTAIVLYERNGHDNEQLNERLRGLCLPAPGDWNHFIDLVLKWHRRRFGSGNGERVLDDLDAAWVGELPEQAAVCAGELLLELEGRRPARMDLPFRALCDVMVRLRSWSAREKDLNDDRRRALGNLVATALGDWLDAESPLKAYELAPLQDRPRRVRLMHGAREVLDYGCFILREDETLYYADGNNRLQRAEYRNPVRDHSIADTDEFLNGQIAWFARIEGLTTDADLAAVVAGSISELEQRPDIHDAEDRVIAGDFKLLEKIGRGGMGIVYKALQISRNRLCAVKILPRAIVADETIFHRFQREARTLESFNHPNIVEYIDFGETERDVYLVMEYIDGVDLDLIIRELRSDINRRPVEDDLRIALTDDNTTPDGFDPELGGRPYYYKVAQWMSEIADALQYIHEDGVLHRDIKHANIMIERSTGRPILLDFGLARNQEMTLTLEGQFLGTMRFASPEQLRGPRFPTDQRADIYSAGVALYELISLRPVFVGDNMELLTHQIAHVDPVGVRRTSPDVPVPLETIIHKCLEKQPRFRYATAADLRDDLARFGRGESIKARTPSARRRIVKWVRNHPTRAVGIAGAILLVLTAAAAMYRILDESERARRAEADALKNAKRYRAERDRALALRLEALNQKRRADEQRDFAVQQKQLVVRESRRARSAEIKVLAESSRTFFSEGKQFEALLPALKAGREAQRRGDELSRDDYYLVAGALHQAVYERRELLRLEGHRGQVRAVDFSPDGGVLISAGREGTLKFWRADNGKILRTARGHSSGAGAAAFHPRADLAASGGEDGAIRLWNRKGEPRGVLRGHVGPVTALRFSPDGKRLVSAGRDWTVRLWSVSGRGTALRVREFKVLNGHVDHVRSADFSPDGRLLISGGDDKTVRVWRAADGRETAVLRGHTDRVNAVRFHSSGKLLASAASDNTIRLWSTRGETRGVLRGHAGSVNTVAFGRRGLLASGSSDGTIRLWRKGRAYKTLRGHGGPVHHIAFSPRGAHIASAGTDRTIRVWRLYGGRAVRTLGRHRGSAYSVRFSPDGRLVASSGSDGRVLLRRVGTGRVARILRGHRGDVNGLAFAPDGRRLASAGSDKTVRVWSLTDAKAAPRVLRGHVGWVSQVAFSPDGSRLASAGGDGTVRLWPLAGDESPRELRGHSGEVFSVDFRGDGRVLASSGRDGTIRLWDPADGALLRVLRGHRGWVTRVRFSPHDALIASASRDKTIKLWRDGKLTRTLSGHSHWVADLDFSPDGRRLISAGRDRTLKFWRLSDGAELNTFRGHPGRVESAVFSPDGRRLASGDTAGLVKIWNLDLPRLVGLACERVRWYLAQSPGVRVEDRALCDGIPENPRVARGITTR